MRVDFYNIDTDDPNAHARSNSPRTVDRIKRYQRRIVAAIWLCRDMARLEMIGREFGIRPEK